MFSLQIRSKIQCTNDEAGQDSILDSILGSPTASIWGMSMDVLQDGRGIPSVRNSAGIFFTYVLPNFRRNWHYIPRNTLEFRKETLTEFRWIPRHSAVSHIRLCNNGTYSISSIQYSFNTCIPMSMSMSMFMFHVHLQVYFHVHVHVQIHRNMHMLMFMSTCIFMVRNIYIHIFIFMYVFMYINMYSTYRLLVNVNVCVQILLLGFMLHEYEYEDGHGQTSTWARTRTWTWTRNKWRNFFWINLYEVQIYVSSGIPCRFSFWIPRKKFLQHSNL
jgi:hypothetical protein